MTDGTLRYFPVLFAAALSLSAQPQFPTFVSSLDGTEQPYALYVPANFDASQEYPLIVSLHSEDANHRLALRQLLGAPNRLGRPMHEDPRFLIACPYARGGMAYQGIAEQDVYDMLAAIARRYPVDLDRVYLTGASVGGGAALWFALTRPDVWAAVAPICPAAFPASEDLAPNLLNLAMRLYHGELDTIVPAASSRAWQRRLLDLDIPASYIEYAGARHNAWDLAYRNGAALDWLAQFRRNRFPDRVRFVTRSYRYTAAYWVRIDAFTPGTLAGIDARRTTPGSVAIETRNLDGFSLTLDRPVASVTIDQVTLRVVPATTLGFVKVAGQWRPGQVQPEGKRVGAEGPIVEAVSIHPIFVYGSLGARTADELEQRRQLAQQAATFRSPHQRVDFAPPVKVDSEVTDAEMASSDLVLFGTAETNLLIARFAASLPLSLAPGAADYGLLFIAPVGRHYALVSSGLPWWSNDGEAARTGYAFAPEPLGLLATLGDYVLFKGSLAQVIAEGRFDRNWKIAADAALRLTASGTVTIRIR